VSGAPSAGVSRPPRLLLVAPQPFFAASGTPLNVRLMCRVLGEAGYEVHLATLPGGEDVDLPGLHHHRTWRLPGMGRVPVGFSLAKLAYTPLLAGLVLGLLLSRRFQAVQALEEAAFYAVPLARLFRCRAVADLDSDLPGQLAAHPARAVRALAGPARALRRLTLRLAHGAVVVAPSLARLVAEAAPATRVALIRDVPPPETLCPPDPAETAALARELGLEGAEVVAYTGNLDRRQGVDLLVEAFARVRAARPRAVLLVVGGENREVAALAGRV
jgi:glycosyltransferase involved in cell wall biosynthesis